MSAPPNVVYGQPSVVTIAHVTPPYGEHPIQTTCPHCRQQILTSIHYVSGQLTWIICIILIVFGCVLGCCLIPFCVEGCQDVEHTCPQCKAFIHRYKRMGNEHRDDHCH